LRRCTSRPAIEDRASSLEATCALWRGGGNRSRWGSGVDGPRSCLRHDDTARSRSGLGRSCGNRCYGCRCLNRWCCDRYRRHCNGSGWRRCNNGRPRDCLRRRSCNDNFALRCGSSGCNRSAGGRNWRPRYNGTCRWLGGDSRRLRRRRNDRRSRPRLRDDTTRCWALRFSWRRCRYGTFDRGSWSSRDRGRRSRSYGSCRAGSAGRSRCRRYWSNGSGSWRRRCNRFLSLLECLENISWLGDTRQVDLRLGCRVATHPTGCAALDSLEVSAHTLGFVELQ
jgi:hypothetical protein